jgi:cytoskeleton protein RodZ
MTEPPLVENLREPGPGAVLAKERKAQGLSLADVSRQLKLAIRQVEALEADNYAALPGATFVRGFVRNYARLLRLHPESLLQALEKTVPGSAVTKREDKPARFISSGSGRTSRRGVWALLILVALVATAVWVDYFGIGIGTGPSSPRPVAKPAAPAPAPAPAPAIAPEPPAPAPPAAPESPPVPVQIPPQEFELKLAVKKDAWIQVKDSQGQVLLSRTVTAGGERTLRGAPPVSLIVGNAANVSLSYNGKPIDLAPHSTGNVARLKLE